MTKTELQLALAEATQTSKKTAGVFLDTLSALAYKTTKKTGEFVLPGFGKLVKQKRRARTGFNPKTQACPSFDEAMLQLDPHRYGRSYKAVGLGRWVGYYSNTSHATYLDPVLLVRPSPGALSGQVWGGVSALLAQRSRRHGRGRHQNPQDCHW